MSRFSAGVAPRTSITCSSQLLPKIVTTGVSAATSSRRLGSSSGRLARWRVLPEGRQLRVLPALLAGGREELDVLGVGARPAALDEREAVLVEHPRDAQLVGERERDVLALGAVAEGRVVEGDGGAVGGGHRCHGVQWPVRVGSSTRLRPVPRRQAVTGRQIAIRSPTMRAISRVPTMVVPRAGAAGRHQVAGPVAVLEGVADGRLDRRRPPAAWPSDQRSSIAADRIVPSGLARSWPGDVGRGAVDRLVQAVPAVRGLAGADRRRREHPQRAADDRRLVGQDVAEQVLGDEDVEGGRRLRQQHRRGVDQPVLQRHVREVRRGPPRSPCATAATSRARSPCRPG